MIKTLETSRLQLRKMTISDSAEVFENWTSSEVVAKYLTWAPHSSLEVTEEYLSLPKLIMIIGFMLRSKLIILIKLINRKYYSKLI